MSSLSVHVWKEWREQRASLGVPAVALSVGAAIVALALPRSFVADPITFGATVLLAMLATLLTVGADLLARERSQGRMGFLERVPGGLAAAFRGKLAFFVILLVGAALFGSLLASGAALIRTGQLPDDFAQGLPLWLLGAVLLVSVWVFAVSAWMPSSVLAFPAAVMLVALLGLPAALLSRGGRLFLPTPIEAALLFGSCVAGALLSAWASFVVGSRLGRTRRRAALVGTSFAVLAFLPQWGWAGMRYAEARNAPFEIVNGWVGHGGRRAFLNLARRAPDPPRITAVVVDLENATWSIPGSVDGSALLPERRYLRRASVLGVDACERFELHEVGEDEPTVFAAETGAPRAPVPEPADFGLATRPAAFTIRWAGLGQGIRFQDEAGDRRELFRDPSGGCAVDRREILPDLTRVYAEVRVRPGRWLAFDGEDWLLFDPVSSASEPLTCLSPGERIGPSVDDGRVLLLAAGKVFLLDPETCERWAIRSDLEVHHVSAGHSFKNPPLAAGSSSAVSIFMSAGPALALLDLGEYALHPSPATFGTRIRILSSRGLRVLVLEDERHLLRLDLESGEREVLFSVDWM